MTSINERIFQLDDPNHISYDRRKQAGTAVPGNITLEHNWFPRCFNEMRLEIGSH